MDKLIALVTQKAGIPADKAQMAITTVLGFLKGKLPAPLAGQIDNAVNGAGDGEGGTPGLDDVKKGLGGMFGG